MRVIVDRTFKRTVHVLTPTDTGHEAESFEATFNYIDLEQFKAFDLDTYEGTTEALRAIVRRLDGLTNGAREPLDYTTSLRDMLFKLPFVRVGLMRTYSEAVAKVSEGN